MNNWQKGLNGDFLYKLNKFFLLAVERGLDLKVCQALRTIEEQNKLYAQGRTTKGKVVTKARGGSSWHNYGLAVDVCFVGKEPFGEHHPWHLIGELAKEVGLDWGGLWQTPDRPHLQYTKGLKIADALVFYKQGGFEAVWNKLT